MTNAEIIAAVIAAISLICTAIATKAAKDSARSAEKANKAAEQADIRAAIREIASSANELLIEERRIQKLGGEMKLKLKTEEIKAGAYGNSRTKLHFVNVDNRIAAIHQLKIDAEKFVSAEHLAGSTEVEIERIRLRLGNSLRETRSLREDFERELTAE